MDNIFFAIYAFIMGSIIGSFLNVCILRIPEGTSIVSPPSRCPQCGQAIRWFDNIPIISFLLLCAKCRYCGEPISCQYALVEILTGAFAVALYLSFPLIEALIYFAFVAALIVVTFIDLEHQIIPDVISLPGVVIGFLCSFALTRITYIDSLIGIAVGGGILLAVALIYYAIMKAEGMGGGDVKLLAMIGAFLGAQAVIATIFISSFLGSAVGLAIIAFKGKDRKYAIPFGPFLAIGAVIYLFWGEPLIEWYRRLL